MATDGGGLSTPEPHPESYKWIYSSADLYQPITVWIRIINDEDDDADIPGDGQTPGLKDNEDGDTDDTKDGTDSGSNDDVDGGDPTPPPPPGTSAVGIIEDFLDNMGDFEQDLFEDFMLVIDDGIEIA